MPSKVTELQFALDKIVKMAKEEHIGASDRRRTLTSITNICARAVQGTLSEVYDIPPEIKE